MSWWGFMLKFRADEFSELLTLLRGLKDFPEGRSLADVPEPIRRECAKRTAQLVKIFWDVELQLSFNSAVKIEGCLKNGEAFTGQLSSYIEELQGRVSEELQARMVFCLSSEMTKYYDQKQPLFGQEVDDAYPSSRFDITESGKCLAFARPTACVMHLMRALEPPLQAMAKEFSVSAARDNWHEVLRLIEKAVLDVHPKADADRKEFFSGACAQFRFFKDAWRNHAMHARVKYTEEEADIIFRSVKAFMRQLADRLRE
jgi:hypothetical protein